MSLADLMRKGSLRVFATATPATVATHEAVNAATVAEVATVAVAKSPDSKAANDPAPDLSDWRVTLPPGIKPETVAKFRAASLALDARIAQAAGSTDPDRWCWPHSDAMNTAEIDRMTGRIALFADRGSGLADAEALADKLVRRDRDGDDRRLCLECAHLGGRRCSAWRLAGIGGQAVAADLVAMPQRCNGFKEASHG